MIDERDVAQIDEILAQWKPAIGRDHHGYRNHVVRMAGFCFALRPCAAEKRHKVLIAACFHDIGLWTTGTFDYLEPSVKRATEDLKRHDLGGWSDEIATMIRQRHKLRPVTAAASPLAEFFRRADLVDCSLGLVRFGLPRDVIPAAKRRYPNCGFHRTIVRIAVPWILRHPLRPAPMVRWRGAADITDLVGHSWRPTQGVMSVPHREAGDPAKEAGPRARRLHRHHPHDLPILRDSPADDGAFAARHHRLRRRGDGGGGSGPLGARSSVPGFCSNVGVNRVPAIHPHDPDSLRDSPRHGMVPRH